MRSAAARTAEPPLDVPLQGPLDVDWDTVGRWAGRLASPGPTAPRDELRRAVADLHDAAGRARDHALRASRLGRALEVSGGADQRAQVLVVDRPGWARAAAQSFDVLAGSASGQPSRTGPGTLEAAGLVALLAGRVLGQFDPFTGRLLLVAPNVLQTERALSADPADFRLWVCVHEQTHALQFAAAPWLADHLRDEVGALARAMARTTAGQEAFAAAGAAVRSLRRGGMPEDWTPLHLLLEEEQRDRVDRITAVMSLLEGHADVTMDAVGARAIPSARRLRARLEARRRRARGIDRVLRRVLGMDAKLAQYRRGARFVRAVRRTGGRDALDAVWAGPGSLPTAAEVADPASWVRRVHG